MHNDIALIIDNAKLTETFYLYKDASYKDGINHSQDPLAKERTILAKQKEKTQKS